MTSIMKCLNALTPRYHQTLFDKLWLRINFQRTLTQTLTLTHIKIKRLSYLNCKSSLLNYS